ncbi:MAG TPA: NUDIX domain-containing protein [Candidatus Pacearchaeota archaeon]|nr:NUDIX domain-containing protein [Candidatus Pacearchaeota archaeon]
MLFKLLKTKKIKNKKITSVSVVIFNDSKEILVVRLLKRGWDIPGGHVEDRDRDVFETAEREVMEEACVEIKDCNILTIIRSYYYREPTYMLILSAKVGKIYEFNKNKESLDRKFMNPLDFLEIYSRINNVELMRGVIKSAISNNELQNKNN